MNKKYLTIGAIVFIGIFIIGFFAFAQRSNWYYNGAENKLKKVVDTWNVDLGSGDLFVTDINVTGTASGSFAYTIMVAASNADPQEIALATFRADGTDDHVEIQAAIDQADSTGNGGKVILSSGTFNIGKPSGATDVDLLADVTDGAGQAVLSNLTFNNGTINDLTVGQMLRLSGGVDDSGGESMEDNATDIITTIIAINVGGGTITIGEDMDGNDYTGGGANRVTAALIIGSIEMKQGVWIEGSGLGGNTGTTLLLLQANANVSMIIAQPSAAAQIGTGMAEISLNGNRANQGDGSTYNFHPMLNGIVINDNMWDSHWRQINVIAFKGDAWVFNQPWGSEVYGGGWTEFNNGYGFVYGSGNNGSLVDHKIADVGEGTGWDSDASNPLPGDSGVFGKGGIKLYYSSRNTIKPQILGVDLGWGIYAKGSQNKIMGIDFLLTANNAEGGIFYEDSDEFIISNNTFQHTGTNNVGIRIHHSNSYVIVNNAFDSGTDNVPIDITESGTTSYGYIANNTHAYVTASGEGIGIIRAKQDAGKFQNNSGSTIIFRHWVKTNTGSGTIAVADASTSAKTPLGMIYGTTANNSYNNVQISGYQSKSGFDVTVARNISVGDRLSVSDETAGLLEEAGDGDWVVAIAEKAWSHGGGGSVAYHPAYILPPAERYSNNEHLKIGAGEAGVDYTLQFIGEDSSGLMTWMEDEDYLKFDDDIVFAGEVVSAGSDYFVVSSYDGAGGNVFIIEDDGDVGIGTTSPRASLEISGGGDALFIVDATNPRIVIGDTTSASDYGELIWNTSGNYLGLDADLERALVLQKDGGNVGIGTTTPASRFDLDYLNITVGTGITISDISGNVDSPGTGTFIGLNVSFVDDGEGTQAGDVNNIYSQYNPSDGAITGDINLYTARLNVEGSADINRINGYKSFITIGDGEAPTFDDDVFEFYASGVDIEDGTSSSPKIIANFYGGAHQVDSGEFGADAIGIYLEEQTVSDGTNAQIFSAGGDWYMDGDDDKFYIGELQDSYIEFDGDSMNIVTTNNDSSDDLVIMADNVFIGNASPSASQIARLSVFADTDTAYGSIGSSTVLPFSINDTGDGEHALIQFRQKSAGDVFIGAVGDGTSNRSSFIIKVDNSGISEALRVLYNGRVGIGTSTPNNSLVVQPTINADGITVTESDSATNAVRIEGKSSGATINMYNNGSISNQINSQGSPTVFNQTGASIDFRIEGNTEENLFFIDGSADSIGIGDNTPDAMLEITSAGSHYFMVSSYDGNDGNIFIIDSDGEVGIGTKTPDELLEVEGNIHLDDNYQAIFGTGKDVGIYQDSSDWWFDSTVGSDTTTSMLFKLFDYYGDTTFEILDSKDNGLFVIDSDGNVNIAGDTNLLKDLNVYGDVDFPASGGGLAYANLYVQDNAVATAITIAGKANKVQIVIFDTDGPSNNATPDHTNDHITITKAGHYMAHVTITVSGDGGDADKFGFAMYKNNGATEFANVHGHRNLAGGAGDIGSIALSGIVDLAVDDTIEVWTWNEDDTHNITVDDISLSLLQIGG